MEEPGEVAAVRVGHRRDEIFARHRTSVVAGEVGVEPAAEPLFAQQRVEHPHHFRPFFIDGRGVEVVDRAVAARPHRVAHRPVIFRELHRLQRRDILNTLHRPCCARFNGVTRHRREAIGGELLIAKDRQPLFEGQLEPVAAGDAVPGPVVEIFVADDRLDVGVVGVTGCFRGDQHIFGVEEVEPLILHRPHVEILDRDDHVAVEIEHAAETLLVPAQRRLERLERPTGTVAVVRRSPDLQQRRAPVGEHYPLFGRDQIGGNQGKEVARFGKGVVPHRVVPTVGQIGRRDQVAVRKQNRVAPLLGAQPHAVAGEHIRAVDEGDDAAKPLRFALGKESARRLVEP